MNLTDFQFTEGAGTFQNVETDVESVTFAATAGFSDVTIPEVSALKQCRVRVAMVMQNSGGLILKVWGELTSTTNLRIHHQANTGITRDVRWLVIDEGSSVNVEHDTESVSFTTAEQTVNVTIPEVSAIANCEVHVPLVLNSAAGVTLKARGHLSTTTNLVLTYQGNTSVSADIPWEVTDHAA